MPSDVPTIGVLDSPSAGDWIAAAIETAGARVASGDAATVSSQNLVAIVAPDDTALSAIAGAPPEVPVLAPSASPGLPGIPRERLSEAIEAVVAGEAHTVDAPLLSVSVDGEHAATAYREVTLVTETPARISEFAIEHAAAGQIDAGRADGVVIATPAGSHGYAAAGGGPRLAPDTGLAVVPIAPFRLERDRWVVSLGALAVSVLRDEAVVTVEVDGTVVDRLDAEGTVSLAPAGTLALVAPPRRGSERGLPFPADRGAADAGLERH